MSLTNEWNSNISLLRCSTFLLLIYANENVNQHSRWNSTHLSFATIAWLQTKRICQQVSKSILQKQSSHVWTRRCWFSCPQHHRELKITGQQANVPHCLLICNQISHVGISPGPTVGNAETDGHTGFRESPLPGWWAGQYEIKYTHSRRWQHWSYKPFFPSLMLPLGYWWPRHLGRSRDGVSLHARVLPLRAHVEH